MAQGTNIHAHNGDRKDDLVDIDHRAPDPSLFQIPPGYRVIPEQPIETP